LAYKIYMWLITKKKKQVHILVILDPWIKARHYDRDQRVYKYNRWAPFSVIHCLNSLIRWNGPFIFLVDIWGNTHIHDMGPLHQKKNSAFSVTVRQVTQHALYYNSYGILTRKGLKNSKKFTVSLNSRVLVSVYWANCYTHLCAFGFFFFFFLAGKPII
jgi:hypothetical protein